MMLTINSEDFTHIQGKGSAGKPRKSWLHGVENDPKMIGVKRLEKNSQEYRCL
jgi:hypothetical protein